MDWWIAGLLFVLLLEKNLDVLPDSLMDCLTPDWCIAWLMNDGLMLQPFEASNILVMASCFLMELPLHLYFRTCFSISIPVRDPQVIQVIQSFLSNGCWPPIRLPSRKTQGQSCCQMKSFMLDMWSHAREMGFSAVFNTNNTTQRERERSRTFCFKCCKSVSPHRNPISMISGRCMHFMQIPSNSVKPLLVGEVGHRRF